MQDFID